MSEPLPPPIPPPVPLGYAQEQGTGRPGILMAVAVISLLMGLITLLRSLGAAFVAVMYQIIPAMTNNVFVPPAATTMPTTVPAAVPATTAATWSASGTLVVTPTTLPRGGNPFAGMQIDYTTLTMSLVDAILRFALAILLIVAAVMVIRDARSGRKLHLIWAAARIPLAIFGAITYQYMQQKMLASMAANMATTGGPPPGAFMPSRHQQMIEASFDIGTTWLYPVAILIVMNTKRVKAFYRSLGK